jgi:hypothetical protein
MGIMICEAHGRVGFVETCSHIAKQIDEGKAPSGRHLATILGNIFVCDDCFNSLGFERCMSLADLPIEEALDIDDGRWEAFDAAYQAIEGRRGFCLKCFAEHCASELAETLAKGEL